VKGRAIWWGQGGGQIGGEQGGAAPSGLRPHPGDICRQIMVFGLFVGGAGRYIWRRFTKGDQGDGRRWFEFFHDGAG
jgi:hypothetical protein